MSLTCFPHFASPEESENSDGDDDLLDKPQGQRSESTRVLILREGPYEEVGSHPDVGPLLQSGWTVEEVYPLAPEQNKRKMLVLLTRNDSS